MSVWGKLIGGATGLALGGPVGAILGIAAGHGVDRVSREKKSNKNNNILIPKISFRFNPSDMKNYSSSKNKIDAGNVFALNRLGLSDTLEAGKSITLDTKEVSIIPER